ncbi:hypothetical protein E2320_007431, partial [Naja naja]
NFNSGIMVCLQNSTVWKPDSCQECGCHGDVVLCEAVACRDPRCNFEKEEILQISPNACCPECAKGTKGFCVYEGQLREPNAEWAGWDAGLALVLTERLLVPANAALLFLARTMKNNPEQEGTAAEPVCQIVCRDGSLRFSPPFVHLHSVIVSSYQLENVVQSVFKNPALHLGHYTSLKLGRFCWEICPLLMSPIFCLLASSQEEDKVRRPGKCCEECVLSKGSCVHNGTLKYHSDMWHDMDCNFCSCDGGRGEELFHLPGKCCPECISRGAPCVYKESTKD